MAERLGLSYLAVNGRLWTRRPATARTAGAAGGASAAG
jgi:hypothetical protein